MAVPSLIHDKVIIIWNKNLIDKVESGQNRIARMTLSPHRYAAVESLRGGKGLSTVRKNKKENMRIMTLFFFFFYFSGHSDMKCCIYYFK